MKKGIQREEKQWLWLICAVMLLVLMFGTSFVCFYQAFQLMNENQSANRPARAAGER